MSGLILNLKNLGFADSVELGREFNGTPFKLIPHEEDLSRLARMIEYARDEGRIPVLIDLVGELEWEGFEALVVDQHDPGKTLSLAQELIGLVATG